MVRREIFFRGKRKIDGEWVMGNLFIPDKSDAPYEICVGTNVIRINYEIDPKTIGQYTGLRDKNGKKIFEGDTVRNIAFTAVVEFYDGRFTPFNGEHGTFYADECEVIGNIHDRYEPLKGE